MLYLYIQDVFIIMSPTYMGRHICLPLYVCPSVCLSGCHTFVNATSPTFLLKLVHNHLYCERNSTYTSQWIWIQFGTKQDDDA
jgi:hypothetical protein